MREHLLIELLLLLEESAIERVSGRIIEQFEAVEDLNSASLLHSNHAPVHARRNWRRNDAVAAVRCGSGIVIVIVIVRCRRWIHLRLDPGVVIRDVDDDERMKLEGQSATR